MAGHALLSASGAYRWLACTPSAILERQFSEESSTFAAEGTAAHALSEHKLKRFLKLRSQKPVSEFDSPEMEEYTDAYVTYACELITEARKRSRDARILLEQKLDFSQYAPQGFGTGDLVIVADRTLDVVDLKYGRGVAVSAQKNPQMMLYALGALQIFDSLYDIQTVRMTIVQPRLDSISTDTLPVDELLRWAETELRPRAELALKGEGEYISGAHCRFCRAKRTCRARAEKNMELAKLDFKAPALLSDEEIGVVLSKVDELTAWVGDIKDYALSEAVSSGKRWPGHKVVEGRSSRKYRDEAKVADAILATGSFNEQDIFTKELLGITAMEKLLGKKQFGALLEHLIVKAPGKPALVPLSDKRPEYNAAIADFKEAI